MDGLQMYMYQSFTELFFRQQLPKRFWCCQAQGFVTGILQSLENWWNNTHNFSLCLATSQQCFTDSNIFLYICLISDINRCMCCHHGRCERRRLCACVTTALGESSVTSPLMTSRTIVGSFLKTHTLSHSPSPPLSLPCFSSPCSNGGTCTATSDNNYTCSCTTGFKGR